MLATVNFEHLRCEKRFYTLFVEDFSYFLFDMAKSATFFILLVLTLHIHEGKIYNSFTYENAMTLSAHAKSGCMNEIYVDCITLKSHDH